MLTSMEGCEAPMLTKSRNKRLDEEQSARGKEKTNRECCYRTLGGLLRRSENPPPGCHNFNRNERESCKWLPWMTTTRSGCCGWAWAVWSCSYPLV